MLAHSDVDSAIGHEFKLVYNYGDYKYAMQTGLLYNDYIGNFSISQYYKTVENIAPMPDIQTIQSIWKAGKKNPNHVAPGCKPVPGTLLKIIGVLLNVVLISLMQ